MIPFSRLALALAASAALAGCSSLESASSSARSSLSEVGSGASGGFVRSQDTLGTQRRMDMYGGATAPVLPTMGAVGYGK